MYSVGDQCSLEEKRDLITDAGDGDAKEMTRIGSNYITGYGLGMSCVILNTKETFVQAYEYHGIKPFEYVEPI